MTVHFTRPQLLELYAEKQMSSQAVGRILGCSGWRVRRALRLHGIELRKSVSGVKGVSWCKQTRKWKVTARVGGKQKTIGRFANLKEATRSAWRNGHYGE